MVTDAPRGDGLRDSIQKVGYRMPVSVQLLLDSGAISEEQAREMGWTPPPPIPRLRRWRWRARYWWWQHRPRVHLGPCDHGDCL